MKDWTVEVLCSGYLALFHHFPPVSEELTEFSSCGSGSVKAQALQEEVNKMLGKGALEMVEHPGPGYCSCKFLVQKATGG